MSDERMSIGLTLDQAVALSHLITNVRSNPTVLEMGCCLDAFSEPIQLLQRLEAIDAELEKVLTFDEGGPRWLKPGENP